MNFKEKSIAMPALLLVPGPDLEANFPFNMYFQLSSICKHVLVGLVETAASSWIIVL